jgi:hypothetical protein
MRLLKPLGNPPVNGIKYFSASDVLELSNDRGWLTKATNAITQHWQKKNGKSSARLQRSNNLVELLPSLTIGAGKQTA